MLPSLIEAHRPQLEALAEAWLASGATAFSLWSNDESLACWPPGADSLETPLSAEIKVSMETIGELRVAGMNSSVAQSRLKAEAKLIASMTLLQNDLDAVVNEAVDQQDQLLAFYNLTQATRDSWEINQILQLLAHEATWLAKAEGTFLFVQLQNQPPLTGQFPRPMLDQRALQECLKNLHLHEHEYLHMTGDELYWLPGIRSLLLIEIPVRDVPVAVMGVVNKIASEFMAPDVRLARAIAEYAGTQIEKVLMFQKNVEQAKMQTELELAQRIQRRLTQETPPSMPQMDLWAVSKPASLVGGDFYDFIPRLKQPFTFVVGDISGKGVPAALLMAITRTVIRTESNTVPLPTPATIVSRSNMDLFDDFTKVSMFATVFIGQYDPPSQRLLFANAGHSPVIYCPAGGEAQLLKADGTALGILPSTMSEDHSMTMGPGDVLVVATDGLNDARNAQDDRFGYNRLLRLTESVAARPAREIADALNGSVMDFSNGVSQEDDQTMVVLKYPGA